MSRSTFLLNSIFKYLRLTLAMCFLFQQASVADVLRCVNSDGADQRSFVDLLGARQCYQYSPSYIKSQEKRHNELMKQLNERENAVIQLDIKTDDKDQNALSVVPLKKKSGAAQTATSGTIENPFSDLAFSYFLVDPCQGEQGYEFLPLKTKQEVQDGGLVQKWFAQEDMLVFPLLWKNGGSAIEVEFQPDFKNNICRFRMTINGDTVVFGFRVGDAEFREKPENMDDAKPYEISEGVYFYGDKYYFDIFEEQNLLLECNFDISPIFTDPLKVDLALNDPAKYNEIYGQTALSNTGTGQPSANVAGSIGSGENGPFSWDYSLGENEDSYSYEDETAYDGGVLGYNASQEENSSVSGPVHLAELLYMVISDKNGVSYDEKLSDPAAEAISLQAGELEAFISLLVDPAFWSFLEGKLEDIAAIYAETGALLEKIKNLHLEFLADPSVKKAMEKLQMSGAMSGAIDLSRGKGISSMISGIEALMLLVKATDKLTEEEKTAVMVRYKELRGLSDGAVFDYLRQLREAKVLFKGLCRAFNGSRKARVEIKYEDKCTKIVITPKKKIVCKNVPLKPIGKPCRSAGPAGENKTCLTAVPEYPIN